jgi:hypothetical protein
MKTTQNALAANKSKSGGSKLPKQPSGGGGGIKSLDQKKVAAKGIGCKRK